MSLRLANITFDCDDTMAVARFWSTALERPIDPDPSEDFASIGAKEDGTEAWYFSRVPESKTAKNRVHPDLLTADRPSVQVEVDRLVGLGATVIRTPQEEYGAYWATLQDPEGNEFCIGAP